MQKSPRPDLQASFTLYGSQNRLSKLLQSSYTTDSPIFYNPRTRFALVKADSSNFCSPRTRFALVKAESLSFYKPPTRIAVVKNRLSKLLQASSKHCSGKKPTLRASTSLLHAGGQNGLFELLQSSYTICGGQNGLSVLLCKPPTRFAVIKWTL